MAVHLPVLGGNGHEQGFAKTARTDGWWVGPAVTFVVFTTFVVYTTWAALQGDHYFSAPYLSPFYSPTLFTDDVNVHSWFGNIPEWMPHWIPGWSSPAIYILIFPGAFRFTCYYYRKAYYRSFAGSPPGCAVGPLASKRTYRGETALLLFQNLHRFALYFALLFVVFLGKDAFESFQLDGKPGIGVGSIILTINVVLIAGYTFGCHSLRHLLGGRKDCMSNCGKDSVALGSWRQASWFNARHMQFAWASLVWVMVTDLYVRLCAMGKIHDWNTW